MSKWIFSGVSNFQKPSETPHIQNKFMMRNSFFYCIAASGMRLGTPLANINPCALAVGSQLGWPPLDLWWHVCPIALIAVEYGIWIYGPWCCTIYNYALCITLPGESRYHLKVGMVESFRTGDLKVRVDWKAYVVHGPYGTNCPWSNLQKLLYNSIFYF